MFRRHGIFSDIFDEMESLSESDRSIRNLSTDMVMASYRHTLSCRSYEGVDSTSELAQSPDVSEPTNDGKSVVGDSPSSSNDITIFNILSDSFKNKYISCKQPLLLEKLKKYPVMKSGMNSKTCQVETYVWRSPGSCRTFEDGGKLGPLRDDKSGKQSNWHTPFFAGLIAMDRTEDRRETKRLACLLCDALTTVQNHRQHLIKHMLVNHREHSDVLQAPRGGLDITRDANNIQWALALKQAQ